MHQPEFRKIGVLALALASLGFAQSTWGATQMTLASFQDKLRGGWMGQMAGVAWGATTEFRYMGQTIPNANVPVWNVGDVNNGFWQDDVYVEIPFMDALKNRGVNCTWTDFGNAFKNSNFMLWHANQAGRNNLVNGIAAPWSGHYSNNPHADDIDWQIEADFVGLIAPGQVAAAKDIAWRAGHVMNYGDGVYGGVAVAAMHAQAYVSTNVREVIEAGRNAVPVGSKYRNAVDDVITWHDQGNTWQQTWQLAQNKYGTGDRCPTIKNEVNNSHANIDAKLNGAYVFMGLLYGNGDMEQSMKIAMQCGQDSDCNPSTVGGIMGNLLGAANMPAKFKNNLNSSSVFSNTNYNFNTAVNLTSDLARQLLLLRGGQVTGSGSNEVWTLGNTTDQPLILEQWPTTTNTAPQLSARIISQNKGTLSFTASATDADGIVSYQWFFGDVSYEAGASITHQYSQIGNYQAICYVTDAVGNTSWQALPISITAVPEPASLMILGLVAPALLSRRRR